MGALLSTGVCLFINLFVTEGNFCFFLESFYSNACLLVFHHVYILFFIFKLLSQDKWIVRTAVGVFGKALSEASCAIIYLYTAKLYPTVVRSVNSKPTHRLSPLCLRILLFSTIVHVYIISVFCCCFFYRQNGLGYTLFVAWLIMSVSPFIMLLEDMWYLLPAVT